MAKRKTYKEQKSTDLNDILYGLHGISEILETQKPSKRIKLMVESIEKIQAGIRLLNGELEWLKKEARRSYVRSIKTEGPADRPVQELTAAKP
jgi:hypothetical protein